MARDAAKIAAMRDFVLANSSNLQTALLIQDAMSGVREKLISDIARRVSGGLQEKDQGWHVLENSLATDPLSKWVLLRWGPPEWRAYGWGVSLSAERPNARGMFFGLRAPSKETTDRKDWQARAMPDEDRGRLFAELAPVLRSAIGHKASKSDWWPCWLWLPNEFWSSPLVDQYTGGDPLSPPRAYLLTRQNLSACCTICLRRVL
jgi:hypothetical protein